MQNNTDAGNKWGLRYFRAAAAAILSAVLLLTACGGEVRRGGSPQTEYEYLVTVGFAQGGPDSRWKAENTESFQSIFVKENGYELLFADAGEDQEAQIRAVRDFIREEADYILLSPVVENGWEEVLEEAREARIPVIVVNGQIDVEDDELYECWIGSDCREQVKELEEWLETYLAEYPPEKLPESGPTQEPGALAAETDPVEEEEPAAFAILQGEIGSIRQVALAEQYEKMFSDHVDWTLQALQTGERERTAAGEVARLFLEQYPGLDVLIAEDAEMAMGAMDAVRKRSAGQEGAARSGREEPLAQTESRIGQDGPVILSLGVDEEVREAVEAGGIQAAFGQSPDLAPKAAEVIRRLEAGVYIDKEQYVADEVYGDFSLDGESRSDL